MPTAEVDAGRPRYPRIRLAVGLVISQVVAALVFVVDSITDIEFSPGGILADFSWLEVGIAVIMLASITIGARLTHRLMIEARDRERVIALAQGAFAEVVAQRFGEWKLSAGESDVALFALKGCSIAEIAGMRGSAEGTVRAQLSQIYTKAGVSSQAMLMAVFLEELIDA